MRKSFFSILQTLVGPYSKPLLIDVILTNKPELFKECGVFDVGISDHALVYGLMKERNGFYESKVLTVRSYKDLNEKELQMDLDMAPWHVSSIFDSIDDQYSYWHTLLTSIVNDHVPLKKMRVRAMDVPYMTLEWKKQLEKKEGLRDDMQEIQLRRTEIS